MIRVTIDHLLSWVASDPIKVLSYIKSDSSLVNSRDSNGYTLLHAAASYGAINLLRAIVNDYAVDVNLRDSDGETALFVTETVDVAKCLIDELGCNFSLKNNDNLTAYEKIFQDGDFPELADWLAAKSGLSSLSPQSSTVLPNYDLSTASSDFKVNFFLKPDSTTRNAATVAENSPEADLKGIIDTLLKEDFHSVESQNILRNAITESLQSAGDTCEPRKSKRI